MKLYYAEVLNPRKVCALARHLGSPVDYVKVDLGKGQQRADAFVAMNPNAKVPVLVDGGRAIWESNAIMAHLAMKAGSDLWPRDERQIDVVRWLSWDLAHFSTYGGALYFEYVVRPLFDLGPADQAVADAALADFRTSAAVLDAHLEGRDWLVGETMTIADFAVAIALPYAERAHIPVAEFPNIQRWHDQLCALDAWRDPFPSAAHA